MNIFANYSRNLQEFGLNPAIFFFQSALQSPYQRALKKLKYVDLIAKMKVE